MNDMGRAQIIWDCLEMLEGAPAMEFVNPGQERLFKRCLDIERNRPVNVMYSPDHYTDIFEYSERLARTIRHKMSADPTKTVADVAEVSALEAGASSTDPRHYIATSMLILVRCEKFGNELQAWFKDSLYWDFLDDQRRLVFPLYYMWVPAGISP